MVALHLLTHHPVFHSYRPRSRSLPSHRLATVVASATPEDHINRRQLIGAAAAITVSPFLGNSTAALAEDALSEWERVYLPIDPGVVLLDIAFVPDDPSHGFLLGTRQTLLETKDGGSTWAQRSIPSAEEEDFNYRFNNISFKGKEGWIIGKPAILLYTADSGDTWKRIPLSAQLPGDMPNCIDGSRTSDKEERPRFFDSKAKNTCWNNAKKVPGRDPDRWRIDAAGNIVCKRLHTCQGCLCFEYDHIIPFSKGGKSVAGNCQILQTRVNRLKSNKSDMDQTLLRGYSCDVKFSAEQLDIIEMAVYGSIVRPGKQCIVGSVDGIHGGNKSRDNMFMCNLSRTITFS